MTRQGGVKQRVRPLSWQNSSLAVLIAGQIRAFVEPQVQLEVYRTAVSATSAAVFAHLSPEHSYAPWHHRGISPEPRLNQSTIRLLIRTVRMLFHPIFLSVEADRALASHSRWVGDLKEDSAGGSALAFRWLLLYDAMSSAEAKRGRIFLYVLRLRPDALLLCQLANPLVMLGNYSAVVDKDVALLARREAASVGLAAYHLASETKACELKRELCVPAVLLRHGFSVGVMRPGAVIVRPKSLCQALQSGSFTLDSSVSCGRQQLALLRPFCRESPRLWNLTRGTLYWRSRRYLSRGHPAPTTRMLGELSQKARRDRDEAETRPRHTHLTPSTALSI